MTFTDDNLSDFWVQSYELAQLTAELREWIADDCPERERAQFNPLNTALQAVQIELSALWRTTAHGVLTNLDPWLPVTLRSGLTFITLDPC